MTHTTFDELGCDRCRKRLSYRRGNIPQNWTSVIQIPGVLMAWEEGTRLHLCPDCTIVVSRALKGETKKCVDGHVEPVEGCSECFYAFPECRNAGGHS